MRYITKDDLVTDSFERLIDESSKDITNTLDKAEARAIALARTYLSAFDTDSIFGILVDPDDEENEPEYTPGIRQELLVEIICKMTLYRIFRRNAARKVPEDVKDDNTWAIKELERIRSGATPMPGLPPAIDDDGSTKSNSMWGNNTNTDFYI